MMSAARWLVVLFGVLAAASPVRTQHWPQFRGQQAGIAPDDPALPERWSRTENVAWAIDIPGRAWSSPIVWGDHVFVTTAINVKEPVQPLKPVPTYTARSLGGPMTGNDIATATGEHRWVLFDIDFKTGKVRWQRTVTASVPLQPVHQKNSYASETPVTDGERVYVYLGFVGLFAFDMNGSPVWSKPMDAVKVRQGWGAAASPVLHNGRLYVVNDNEERSYLAAFDAKTGAELWRVDREEASNWTTPYVWQHQGRTEIVTLGSRRARAYDVNGKLLWELSGMSSIQVSTPFARDGLLYVSSGYTADATRPIFAIRPGASGDISLKAGETGNQSIAWSQPTAAAHHPSGLVVGDTYYTLLDRGFLTAHDAATGKEIYGRQRISAESSGFTASPWSYNGKIFALSEDGDTFVIQPGSEFRVLGKNSLDEMALATPAVAHGSVIIRTAGRLYRIARSPRRP